MNMSRKHLVFGLVAVSLFAAIVYVILESPRFINGRIAGVKIGAGWTDYFFVTSDQMDCTNDASGGRTDCSLLLEGETLSASATYTPGGSLINCSATYGDAPVNCEANHAIFNTSGLGIYINDNLGINAERMATLRAQRPLLYWHEATWITLINVLAIAVTILLLIGFWMFRPRNTATRLIYHVAKSGAIAVFGGFLWYGSLWGLIILGYVD